MKNNGNIPEIVITNLSNHISYIQWFVYGLMLLSRENKIRLKFRLSLIQRMLLTNNMMLLWRAINKIKRMFDGSAEVKAKALYMRGYVKIKGEKRTFCIDYADSPNMFSGKLLETVDCYFKLQCPKNIIEEGFKLGDIYLPYFDSEFENPLDNGKIKGKRKLCPQVYKYRDKIKPLMVAVRSMGNSCSFKELDAFYRNLLKSRDIEKSKTAMCYFGFAYGPVPSEHVVYPDYDWESDIMGYFGNQLHHPNEKRNKIADILSSMGDKYDARVICSGNSDGESGSQRTDLIIPLKDFSAFVAQFQYNINVSGYRMSIPARFIDSFICGTAIATDNLEVKWYHPFGKEVFEFGEMGYLRDENVNYSTIREKLASLPQINKSEIIDIYEKYWSPKAVANYLVATTINS